MSSTLPTFDLKRNYARLSGEIDDAIKRVLESQHFILGPEVKAFEEEAAAYLETSHAIGTASGSDALLLALMALDLKPGDEVITTTYSFFATVSAITRLGGTPVFVDIDPESYNVDPARVLEKVTSRTKAFLPVHLFGQMMPLEGLADELKARGIAIVEDCAQSFGSWRRVGDRIIRSGTWGELGCFSFFPTKNLGCYGDGGMVCSSDDGLNERVRCLRTHGAGKEYHHDEVGLNSRLDALQAAILRVRLGHLELWNEERRAVAERYRLMFAQAGLLDHVTPPIETEGNYHIYHQYVIRAEKRDELGAWLYEQGIGNRIYYPIPLHMQRCFAFVGCKEGDFPEAERLAKESLALPIFPEILPEEQQRVVDAMAAFYRR